MGQQVSGAAALIELVEALEIAGEGTLMLASGEASADDLEWGVEKNYGRRMAGEKLAVGGLEKSSSTKGEDGGTRKAREDAGEMMMFNGSESALAEVGKEAGNGSVDAGNLEVKIDERAGEPGGKHAPERAFASPHEADEDQQRGWRITGH
jgi:hypothetical protein